MHIFGLEGRVKIVFFGMKEGSVECWLSLWAADKLAVANTERRAYQGLLAPQPVCLWEGDWPRCGKVPSSATQAGNQRCVCAPLSVGPAWTLGRTERKRLWVSVAELIGESRKVV